MQILHFSDIFLCINFKFIKCLIFKFAELLRILYISEISLINIDKLFSITICYFYGSCNSLISILYY